MWGWLGPHLAGHSLCNVAQPCSAMWFISDSWSMYFCDVRAGRDCTHFLHFWFNCSCWSANQMLEPVTMVELVGLLILVDGRRICLCFKCHLLFEQHTEWLICRAMTHHRVCKEACLCSLSTVTKPVTKTKKPDTPLAMGRGHCKHAPLIIAH